MKKPPEGTDESVRADSLRGGEWIMHPNTGEWVNVSRAGTGNVCVGFGGQKTWCVELRGVPGPAGLLQPLIDDMLVVRIPRSAP